MGLRHDLIYIISGLRQTISTFILDLLHKEPQFIWIEHIPDSIWCNHNSQWLTTFIVLINLYFRLGNHPYVFSHSVSDWPRHGQPRHVNVPAPNSVRCFEVIRVRNDLLIVVLGYDVDLSLNSAFVLPLYSMLLVCSVGFVISWLQKYRPILAYHNWPWVSTISSHDERGAHNH